MILSEKQNWYKYRSLFPDCSSKEKGLFTISFHDKIIHGSVSRPYGATPENFQEIEMPIEDVGSAFETLTNRYNARSLTVLRRDDLLKTVMELMPPPGEPSTVPSYGKQLSDVRAALSLEKRDKNAKYEFRGDVPNEHCLPRPHFFTNIYSSMISDLLPEDKLLFLGIVDEDKKQFSSILLEFSGRELVSFADPDFSNFDWRSLVQTFPNREAAERFVTWCESRYQVPAYTVFVTAKVWREATVYQQKFGYRAAWKHLLKARSGSDLDRELLIEPEPWPMRAIFHWHAMRG